MPRGLSGIQSLGLGLLRNNSRLPPKEEMLNTQTVDAGVTLTFTDTPRLYNVTATIPVGETVTIADTGTLVITGY